MTYTASGKVEGHRTQAKRKSRYKRIRAAVKRIAGWTAFIMYVLILGNAGASDCGAAWEEVFPSTLIYFVIGIVSFKVWELTGGNNDTIN